MAEKTVPTQAVPVETPAPAVFRSVSEIAATNPMILGWVDHEIDSVADHNGVVTKIKVHSIGVVPAK